MPAVDYRKYEGQTLNRTYCLDRLIKRGGMGAVFEASHSRLPEKKFAVKILYIDAEDDPEIATRFRQEAEVTSRLRHENIVEVLDYDETDDGVPYLVMELLEGEELGARLRRVKRPFDLPTAQTIFEQAAAGLGAAHAAGIVHRDVKPSNLFIIPRGNGELIKVLDFGVSKIVGAQTSITRTQMSIGTPRYMAPEQARGEAGGVDARADIFALSTIFYEMLAGRHCFRGQSIPEILYKIVHEHPDPIETLRPDLPPAVINTIRWGLCKRRRDRPQSMSELLQVTRGLAPPPQEVLDAGAETMISHSQVTGPLAPVGDLPTRGRVHTGPMTPPPLDPGLASFEQQTLASLTPSGASAVNPHQQSTASLRPRQPATTGPMRPYETAETAELEAAPTVMTPTPSSLSARGVALYGDGSHSHSSHSHSGHSRGSGSVPVGYGSGASYGSHASFGSSASFGTAQGPSDSTLSAGTGQVAPIASPPPSRSSAALRWGGLAFATAAVGALVVVLVLRVTDPSRGSGAGSGSAIAANTGSAANTANAAGSGSAEGSASAAGSAMAGSAAAAGTGSASSAGAGSAGAGNASSAGAGSASGDSAGAGSASAAGASAAAGSGAGSAADDVSGDAAGSSSGSGASLASKSASAAARRRARRLAIARARARARHRKGTLRVMTTSGGESVWATVYVDGKKIGESPTSVTLAPGRHRVEIKRPGYKPLRRTVTVRGGRTQPLVLPLSKHSPRKTSPRPAR